MECEKCGYQWMHRDDDRKHNIEAFSCLVCGNRLYPGYPRRCVGYEQEIWENTGLLEIIKQFR